jgi:hypothetical protein
MSFAIAGAIGLLVAPQIIGSVVSAINPNAPKPEKSSLEKLIDFITNWLPIILIAAAVLYGLNFAKGLGVFGTKA